MLSAYSLITISSLAALAVPPKLRFCLKRGQSNAQFIVNSAFRGHDDRGYPFIFLRNSARARSGKRWVSLTFKTAAKTAAFCSIISRRCRHLRERESSGSPRAHSAETGVEARAGSAIDRSEERR